MKRLGAIIAGGQSLRFGGDKGAALLNGIALIDHVANALRPQVDALIIVGREWSGLVSIADAPAPRLGPLGGLNAALTYAQTNGYDEVITAGCDTLPIPNNLLSLLTGVPSVVAEHYLIGRWPSNLASALVEHLASQSDRSMRGWLAACAAQMIPVPQPFYNLNAPEALAAFAANSFSAEQP